MTMMKPMTARDVMLDTMHRRITHQRRELRKQARYIKSLQETVQRGYSHSQDLRRALSAERNAKYRTKAYRLWIWWRNKIVWRVGALVPGRHKYWTRRYGYEQGQREWNWRK